MRYRDSTDDKLDNRRDGIGMYKCMNQIKKVKKKCCRNYLIIDVQEARKERRWRENMLELANKRYTGDRRPYKCVNNNRN